MSQDQHTFQGVHNLPGWTFEAENVIKLINTTQSIQAFTGQMKKDVRMCNTHLL